MKLDQKYYIHTPNHWSEEDLAGIKSELASLGFAHSQDAAIGEGIGGHGFETVVEVALGYYQNPIVMSVAINLVYDLAKSLIKKRPKNPSKPKDIPETYRFVVHIKSESSSTIVGMMLPDEEDKLDASFKKELEQRLKENPGKIEYSNGEWSSL